ncbi:MAG: phosphatase PAP2 family protein [Calditrichaeota bacterium]|nr:phosphatase PAP2 family protein [Calditrichota bacterium]
MSKILSQSWLNLCADLSLVRSQRVFAEKSAFKSLSAVIILHVLLAMIIYLTNGYHGAFQTINNLSAFIPQVILQWITFMGDMVFPAIVVLFLSRKYPQLVWLIFLSSLIGLLLTHSVKPLIDASRPAAVLAENSFYLVGKAVHQNSFPSGHSLTIFVLCAILVYLIENKLLRITIYCYALLVAFSRVLVGAHWPIDVLIGSAFGLITVLLAVRIAQSWSWGLRPSGHFCIVSLLSVAVFKTFSYDGGYPLVQPLAALIALSSLMICIYNYIGPTFITSLSPANSSQLK